MRAPVAMFLLLAACGSRAGGDSDAGNGDGDGDGGNGGSDAITIDAPKYAELWYAIDDQLVYIPLNTSNGDVVDFKSSTLSGITLPAGQSMLTMLPDGSLLAGRQDQAADETTLFYIPSPPRDGSPATAVLLGVMPDGINLEGLYTDCDDRLYGMDTGVDVGSSDGNRLLRFTGNPIAGDFTFAVVSDLSSAVVADIDDMSPGIENNEIHDNPGLAIDTSDVYEFNFETGTGTMGGNGGTWGIHALGKELFTDGMARLYVLSSDAQLYRMDPATYQLSPSLGTGPSAVSANPGWSGLAGPLTECDSGFVIF
ncbi:MAG: hypothetical protein AB7O24_13455 [Kofleriaceae bacterium]